METTTNKLEETVKIENDSIQNQLEALNSQKVERITSFRDYAFEKAGLNRGESPSLRANLQLIKDGHIVDGTIGENEQNILKLGIEAKIGDKLDEKEKIDGEKRKASEVSKPAIEKKIKEINDEIQQTKIDLVENKIQTGYQPEKYYMYVTLTVLLSLYLLFFYASAIYASFFRNPSSILKLAGDDIALYLDSIFDIKGIFTLSPLLLIVYLGAFLFFAIGLIPHNLEGENKKRNIILAIIGAFIADSLMAYKIDIGIHDLKVMAGIADTDWHFYSSINFYMVLLFGFCAYLVWGYMFEMMLKEKTKKTGDVKAALIITGLKEDMKILKEDLQILETKIIELETQIKNIIAQIEKLKKDLERRLTDPNTLSKNLTSFYLGWRQYLVGSGASDLVKSKCEETFNNFMNEQFIPVPSLN
jgi:hypothetical protein